jgi:hypothetical protein
MINERTHTAFSLLTLCLVICAAGAALWIVVDASFRGLDLSDEGMYLLSATASDPQSSFHNPFGGYTKFLLQLSFNQIWLFRVLSIFLLCVTGMILGLKLARVRCTESRSQLFIYVLTGSTVAFFYFATGLITPSYNSLNVLALTLGGISCLEASRAQTLTWRKSSSVGFITALACWLGLFAKVSSAPGILLLLLASLVISRKSLQEVFRLLTGTSAFALVFFVFHIVVIEPIGITFEKITRGHENILLLDPGYSLNRAWNNFWWGSREWIIKAPTQFEIVTFMCMALVLVVLIYSRLGKKTATATRIQTLVSLGTLAILITFFVLAYNDGLWAGYSEKYINQMWAVSGLFAICAIGLCASRFLTRSVSLASDVLPPLLLLGLSVLYAFGSGNGFIAQLTGASGFIALAALYLFDSIEQKRRVGISILSLLIVVGSLQVTREARIHPYRQAPRTQQTHALEIQKGYGTLFVDFQLKELVSQLRSQMNQSGWTDGTPLLDLTSYSAGLVFVLGGRPPVTIIPTVGLYPTVNQVAEWSVSKTIEHDPDWKKAWLLLPSDAELNPPIGRPSPDVVRILGKIFPSDYEKIAESFQFAVWKPKER